MNIPEPDIAKSIRILLAKLGKDRLWLVGEIKCSKSLIDKIMAPSTTICPTLWFIRDVAKLGKVPVSEFIAWGEEDEI
jgi:hypothetical protein